MDNQITIIGIVRILKNKDYFFLRYLAKDPVMGKYETKEIKIFHTRDTKRGVKSLRNGMMVLVNGQLYEAKDANFAVRVDQYFILKDKTGNSSAAYLIKYGMECNRVEIDHVTEHIVTHPKPIHGEIYYSGKLQLDALQELAIPIAMRV